MKVPMVWKGTSRLIDGRRVNAGDTVRLPSQFVKAAKALGWATDAPVEVPEAVVYTPPAPKRAPRAAQKPAEDIEKLRAQYEAKKGEAPDRRWGLTRLMQELGGRTYQRRDMRAKD